MKKREFNKILKSVCGDDKLIDTKLISGLHNDIKNDMISYIVRNKMPVVTELLNDNTDMEWLNAMGYLEYKKGKKFNFLCTCENKIKIQ